MANDPHTFSSGFAEAERAYIQRALQEHGDPIAPGLAARPVEVALRDGKGQLIGGLLGSTAWEWLVIDMLWVDESYRGQGLGSSLLEQAENLARSLDCTRARTETFEFQALPFYELHGYTVYAQLDDFPVGHTEYQLAKAL